MVFICSKSSVIKTMSNETKGMLYGLLGVTLFGLTLPATRVVIPYVDPLFIGLGRAMIAALLAISLLIVLRKKLPNKSQWLQLVVVALGVVVGFPVLASWSMEYLPATHGGVVLGVLPLMTALFGAFVGSEKPSAAFWLVSVIGGALVIGYSLLQGAGSFHYADFLLLGAVIAAAIGYAVGARLAKTLGGWQVICWAHVLAFPFILLPAIYTAPQNFSDIPAIATFNFLYLAIFSQLLGFFVWYKGLALGGIARVSQTQLLQPIITLLASVLFLGEVVDVQTLIFIMLIVGSVWIGKKMPIAGAS